MAETRGREEEDAAGQRLARLSGFLARDPDNAKLLAEAAEAAFAAKDFARAAELIDRHAALSPLSPALTNLRGHVALAREDYGQARAIFEQLIADGHDSGALRFNLAWTLAMTGQHGEALALLDDEAVGASPRAPALKIRMLHHLGRSGEGLACGEAMLTRFADNRELFGALATLALDAQQPELARRYGERGRGSADGEAALGVLALGAQDAAGARALFDAALAQEPDNARAWVGRGLAQQALGENAAAAAAIDKGAELFGDHPGSWIAAGWAYFVAGDAARARARFETALEIDGNFSEGHGGLAVLDLSAGDMTQARRRCDIALRLDRNSFGGALAKSLLLESEGNAAAARNVRDIALNTPIGADGMTIAKAMAGFGGGGRKR